MSVSKSKLLREVCVIGLRRWSGRGPDHEAKVRIALLEKNGGLFIWIVEGGVTGWEYIGVSRDALTRREDFQKMMEHGWTACAGSDEWDRLHLPPDQVTKALSALFPEDVP